MKKQLMSVMNATLNNKFFKTAVVVLLLAGPVSAASGKPDPGVTHTFIRHITTNSDAIVFEVKIDNKSGEKFTVLIKDNSGIILYRASYTDKDFAKKFQLPKNESNNYTFVVKDANGNTTETFEVKSNTKTVEEVTVKKMI